MQPRRPQTRRINPKTRGHLGCPRVVLMCPEGFEPPAFCSVDRRSIQLSYGHFLALLRAAQEEIIPRLAQRVKT